MTTTRNKERRVQLTARVSPTTVERLREIAQANGVKRSDVVRRLVEDHVGFDPTRKPGTHPGC